MIRQPIDNGSGYGRGKYASQADTDAYLEKMRGYLRKRAAEWLDRNTDEHGNVREGVRELHAFCNEWRLDSHLAKWAEQMGLIALGSVPEGGIKNRQIGRYTSLIYSRSIEDRRLLTREAARYIDQAMTEELDRMKQKEDQCRSDSQHR